MFEVMFFKILKNDSIVNVQYTKFYNFKTYN